MATAHPDDVLYPQGRWVFRAMLWFGTFSLVAQLVLVVSEGPSFNGAFQTVLALVLVVQGYTMGRRQVQVTPDGLTWCDGWHWHGVRWEDVVGMPGPTRWGPGEGKLLMTEGDPVTLLPLRPEDMQRVRDAVAHRASGGSRQA